MRMTEVDYEAPPLDIIVEAKDDRVKVRSLFARAERLG